jgi:hypothetical protein
VKADLIEQNLEGVIPSFVYGATLLAMGFKLTTENQWIVASELYCVTPFGVWRVE